MKRMLIVCLLGMGLLLPSTTITAKEFFKRIVDVYKEGSVLRATSDSNTGGITRIRIYNSSNVLQREQTCDGVYICNISISGLHVGSYHAEVTTTLTVYYEDFSM